MSAERSELCGDCGSPLEGHQRYCLSCGARVGPPSPQLAELLRRVGGAKGEMPEPRAASAGTGSPGAGDLGTPSAGTPSAGTTSPPAPARPGAGGLRIPPARISALLVLVFLGFGVLLGAAAGSPVQDTLAASVSPRLKVVLPAAAPAATTPVAHGGEAPASSGAGAAEETEAPATEAQATPTPAPTKTAAATTPSSSEGSSGGSSESAGSGESGAGSAAAPATKLPPIKHVFVVMLSDQPYAAVFGPISQAHYLSGTLEHRGTLLVRYDAVAHEELANELALLSGQGPTAETAANCPTYADLAPTGVGADEQVLGSGCVYPATTKTLPGQLTAKRLSWRAYVQGSDEAGAPAGACSHPAPGQPDPSADQTVGGGAYATFRNPFVYFQSIVGSSQCAGEDVGAAQLKRDLKTVKSTPNFSYIVPDRCHDGNPTPCATGAPAGLGPADDFLKQVVPEIVGSKAYKEDGLLVITVDEAPSSGEFADSSSCCGQPRFPNAAASTTVAGLSPRGGGTVGALLLSPYLLKAGTTSQEPYNHFSLLRTIEDLFGLGHLGYAALPAVKPIETAIFAAKKQ